MILKLGTLTTKTLEPHGQGKSSGFMECSLIVK